jgi:hypothetical protein
VTNREWDAARRRGALSSRGSAGIGASRTPAIVLAALLVAPTLATASILRVPEDHATVRAAVAAAANRDTILIAPGTHAGGAFVDRKSLTLASRFITTGDTSLVAKTILRGAAGDMCSGQPGCVGRSVLEFGAAAHGSAVVGLTVTGAEDGIRSQAMVDITGCRIVGNGDGVDFVSGSGGTFRGSLFAWNSDDGSTQRPHPGADRGQRHPREQTGRVEYRPTPTRADPDDRVRRQPHPREQERRHPAHRLSRRVEPRHPDRGESVQRQRRCRGGGCLPDGRTIEDFGGAALVERILLVGNTFTGERHGMIGGANVVVANNIFTGIRESALRRVKGALVTSSNVFSKNGKDLDECALEPTGAFEVGPTATEGARP